ncbi:hypothetical protein Lser_V15G42432 [Lactuca serriola]
MKSINDLLANIENPIPEKSFIAHLLNGLSPQFENISMLLRHRDPFTTYNLVRSKLLVEESRLKSNCPTPPSHLDHSSAPSILYAANSSRTLSSSNRSGRRPNQNRRGGGNSDSHRRILLGLVICCIPNRFLGTHSPYRGRIFLGGIHLLGPAIDPIQQPNGACLTHQPNQFNRAFLVPHLPLQQLHITQPPLQLFGLHGSGSLQYLKISLSTSLKPSTP